MQKRAPTAWSTVWSSRPLRSAFLALAISGVGVSSTTPQLTLFLTRELGASLPVAGFYYLTNLAAPVAGFCVGRLSDRRDDRLVLFRLCALVGAVGWLVMATTTTLWVPFVVSAVALSISGASMAQLFAAVRDELDRHPTGLDNRVVALVRMGFTGGWIVGPVLGSWFGAAFGLRSLLYATAACTLLQILPLGRQRVLRHRGRAYRPTGVPTRALRRMAPLLLFTGLCVLAMAGDTIKFGYLPLYMADQLRLPDGLRGAVIGVQPLLELALMPFAGRLADRFGPLRVLAVGIGCGALADLAYATSTGVAGLFLGQALMACLWATLGALGVTVAQHLYPEGAATASGVFLSAIALGAAAGGVLGGVGVAVLGLPHVFFVPAVLTGLAAIGLAVFVRDPVPAGGGELLRS